MRIALLVLVSALCACSSDDPVERTPEAFCARYQELAEVHDANVKTVAPVEQSSPGEVTSLAEHAPDEELSSALEEIAELQPGVIEMMEATRDRDVEPEDVDVDGMRDVLDRYVRAARVVHDERHRLCDG